MYKMIRAVFFLFDPERVHYFSMNLLGYVCRYSWLRKTIMSKFDTPHKPVIFAGLKFRNIVGLGAGFDKNAKYLPALHALGFGFVETGTVTPLAQDGNEKPRLFRLPADKAIINRMGFNNDGVESVLKNLQAWRKRSYGKDMLIGGNIGKNKSTPNEEAWRDYEICFRQLYNDVDYFVVNVSSPNTPGLRELQEKPALLKILTNLQEIRKTFEIKKPLLLKIAPDLSFHQVNDIISLAMEISLDGLIISNTTITRTGLKTSAKQIEKIGAGGLSGEPLRHASNELLQYVHERSGGKINLIGSGGIFSKDDARKKISCGAGLVQVWTGFIYEGPSIVKNILKD